MVDKEGVIIVGDTRYKAGLRLALKKVPVHVARDLTEEQIKAYRIMDNKTGELAEWDEERLRQELAELEKLDFDLDLLGFSVDELNVLLDDLNVGQVDPDDVPAPPDDPITQPGDLWVLGNHRLLCGDSSTPEEVDRLLDGAAVHLVMGLMSSRARTMRLPPASALSRAPSIIRDLMPPATRKKPSPPPGSYEPRIGLSPTIF